MQRRFAVMMLVLGVLAGVFVARLPDTIELLGGGARWPRAVTEVQRLISTRHVSPPTEEELYIAAIDGMVGLLNDPYTEFVPPQHVAAFEKDMTGQFVGIGATITSRDGLPQIISPMPGSPALRAGLQPGDRILEVDGVSAKGMSLDDNIQRVMGEPGTIVTLTIERRVGDVHAAIAPVVVKVPIVREAVAAPVVSGVRWNAPEGRYDYLLDHAQRIAYVRLDQFTPTAGEELHEAIESAAADAGPAGLGGVVLDLRDNPGGVLDVAIEICEFFVNNGVLVTTRGREGSRVEGESIEAGSGAQWPDTPIVVLVNETSASASEIVAGALQDRGRATVVGTRSFGKGLVQGIEEVHAVSGSLLKLTEQHYYLPSGRLIQRTDESTTWGVDPAPGFYMPMTDEEHMDAFRRRQEWTAAWPTGVTPAAPSRPEPIWNDPASIRERGSDPQLACAVDAIQKRVTGGAWVATGQPSPPTGEVRVSADKQHDLEDLRARLVRELNRVERRLAVIHDGGQDAPKSARTDLWPDAIDLSGGHIEIKDAHDTPIARLRITGPTVEAWLLDADVEPEPLNGAPSSPPVPTPAGTP